MLREDFAILLDHFEKRKRMIDLDRYKADIASLTDTELETETYALFCLFPRDTVDFVHTKLVACYNECIKRKNFSMYERAYRDSLDVPQAQEEEK